VWNELKNGCASKRAVFFNAELIFLPREWRGSWFFFKSASACYGAIAGSTLLFASFADLWVKGCRLAVSKVPAGADANPLFVFSPDSDFLICIGERALYCTEKRTPWAQQYSE
jgi:hypothetical protein